MGRALLLLLLATGCDRAKADLAPITQADETLKKDELDLFSQRGALQRERRRLVDERAEIAEKRRAVAATDRATAAALADQEVQLARKEGELLRQEADLSKKLDALLVQRAELIQRATQQIAVAPGASAEERATRREQGAAAREKDVAAREKAVAEREEALAAREQALAKREKETCGVAAPAPVAAAPKIELPKGLRYGAGDVEPTYKRALKVMQEQGLLASDLPGGGKLIDETRAAMQAGDFVRAKYTAEQLLEEVQAVRVDRAFIASKMTRLSGAMKGRSLDGEARKQVDSLFQEATAAYGDGKFAVANQKINRLLSLMK